MKSKKENMENEKCVCKFKEIENETPQQIKKNEKKMPHPSDL